MIVMELAITLSLILLIIYFLFVKGLFWKLILGFFGWIGLNTYLASNTTWGKNTVITILDYNISWAVFIPSLLIILVMATTRIKEE